MQAANPLEHLPSPGAERMARHRLRRKRGLRSLAIDILETEINALIRRGRLAPESRGDLVAVRRALYRFFNDTLIPFGDAVTRNGQKRSTGNALRCAST
jgi:hypothetical protein